MIAIANADRDKIVGLLRLFAQSPPPSPSTRHANDRRMASVLANRLERKDPEFPAPKKNAAPDL